MDRIRNIHPRNWQLHDFVGWLSCAPALVAFYFLMVYTYGHELVTKTVKIDGVDKAIPFSHAFNAIEKDGWPGFIAPLVIFLVLALLWWLAVAMQDDWVRFVGLIVSFVAGALAGKWLWDTISSKKFDPASFWRGFGTFAVVVFLLVVNLIYYNDCE
jgi:hypothetical protein